MITIQQAVKCHLFDELLTVKVINGNPVLVYWSSERGRTVLLHVFMGWPIPLFDGQYLGTYLTTCAVWHVFEAST